MAIYMSLHVYAIDIAHLVIFHNTHYATTQDRGGRLAESNRVVKGLG